MKRAPEVPAHDPYSGGHSSEYGTPVEFFVRVDRVWRFTLDVCARPENAKVRRFFAPPAENHPIHTRPLEGICPAIGHDGLAQDWNREVCWMNPPYSRGVINLWIAKAVEEARRDAVVVALLPAGVGTAWFHELVKPNARVVPVRGRIQFDHAPAGAKTDSILAEFLPPEYGVRP